MVVRFVPSQRPGSPAAAELPAPLRDLLALVSSMAARWEDLDEAARLAIVRQLQSLTTELGLLTRTELAAEKGNPSGSTEPHEVMRLTPRELDVLVALADGNSTGHVATLLEISPVTVRSHVKSLLSKLGVHSRLEAVSLLLRHHGRDAGGEPRAGRDLRRTS